MAAPNLCSEELVTVAPDEDLDRAVALMREYSIRRLPVVEGDDRVGVISLGDVSAAGPNTWRAQQEVGPRKGRPKGPCHRAFGSFRAPRSGERAARMPCGGITAGGVDESAGTSAYRTGPGPPRRPRCR
ncbi:CBS domain-containing protein [Streptomyces sp. HUAS TT20]|uniref:CBS domain-containing protein n=1 Tax=Streptomyces sp. HUAS TT20 TaxID=3447509 RepID=UPI003985E409